MAWRRISRKNEKERAGGAGGSGLVAVMPVGGEQIEEGFGKSDIPKGLIEEMRRSSEKREKEDLAKSIEEILVQLKRTIGESARASDEEIVARLEKVIGESKKQK